MKMSSLLIRSAVAAALAFGAGATGAATYNIGLAGTAGDVTFSSQDFPGTHYDNWFLSLAPVDPTSFYSSIVAQGDIINATITLDTSLTIPASVERTGFVLYFWASGFTGDPVTTSGDITFFNGPDTVLSRIGSGTGTSGALASSANWWPPDNGAITFDQATVDFSIDTLTAPVTLTGSSLRFVLVSPAPVPEPESYALMLAGLGLLTWMVRRGKV